MVGGVKCIPLLFNIRFPAKIYINAHASGEDDSIYQRFVDPKAHESINGISYRKLAELFNDVLCRHRNKPIAFHFIVCKPVHFVQPFVEELYRTGFTKVVAIYYTDTVIECSDKNEANSNNFVIKEIYTKERAYHAISEPLTSSDDSGNSCSSGRSSSLPENKAIAYMDNERIVTNSYREYKQKIIDRYGTNSRNNFFLKV